MKNEKWKNEKWKMKNEKMKENQRLQLSQNDNSLSSSSNSYLKMLSTWVQFYFMYNFSFSHILSFSSISVFTDLSSWRFDCKI